MNLSARLIQLYRHLWTSYWCIPVAILLAAIALAALTTGLDHVYGDVFETEIFYLRPLQPETARVVLSMIAGSIIGVAGVVFSITMVAVSFASGTFGPRLIGNMMRDRGSQVSLGCFIGTFVYSLIVLRFVRVDSGIGDAFTPYMSIGTSMALAIFCMGVLIYFIHHVPETINIELIIARLGRDLKSGIKTRFPRKDDGPTPLRSENTPWIDSADIDDAEMISPMDEGYIQALDVNQLGELAEKHDLRVKILHRPGAFVTLCDPVCAVWSENALSGEARRKLQGCFALGSSPTVNQNIEFVADQLVEIIARALSPGVNDPYTAVAAINWLQVGILEFAASENMADSFNQTDRVCADTYLFNDFVSAIFIKSSPYIMSNAHVTRHTIAALLSIAAHLPPGNNRDVIEARVQTFSDHKDSD